MTAVEVDYDAADSGQGTATIARGMDKTYHLHHGRKTKTWKQETASSVTQQVASSAGLSVGKVDATTTTYEHIVQGNLTDLEFVKLRQTRQGGRRIRWQVPLPARAQASAGPPRAGSPPPDSIRSSWWQKAT